MVAAEVEERVEPAVGGDFGDVRLPREYVISQQGRDYVLSDGLIVGLHQLSHGYFDVETRLEQLPSEANGMLAVCSARVTVFAPEDRERVLRMATGIGDASPQNVGRLIIPHIVRMAETRALSRALRTLLGKGMAALEELGPDEAPGFAEKAREPERDRGSLAINIATGQVEGIVIEGKRYTRPQVETGYGLRLAETERLGIAIPPQFVIRSLGQASLPEIHGAAQELRRLCEATQAGQR